MDSPADIVNELRAKAIQSFRTRSLAAMASGRGPEDHVCHRAAEKITELCRGKDGNVPVRAVREAFTRLLNLHRDQRAYSWHEIQYALEQIEKDATL